MTDDALLALLGRAADAVSTGLATVRSWGLVEGSAAQHHSDLVADAAALAVLDAAGVGVLSEESGLRRPDADLLVVLDPLDGSTNAAQGLPWFATSLCCLDADGPRAALVRNLATGEEFTAIRGGGAFVDGRPLQPVLRRVTELGEAIVGLSGLPRNHLGWRQFRAFGAVALDLCAVAAGRLDAFVDCSLDAHGAWDYLGGVLVCREAGVTVVDAQGRDLVVREHGARRTPVAGSVDVVSALVTAWSDACGPDRSVRQAQEAPCPGT